MSEMTKALAEQFDAAFANISQFIRELKEDLHESHVQTALALACLGERFPTRGEVATRIVRRALVLMELDREIQRREGDYYAQQDYRQVTGFWTAERREQLPVELQPILDEILKTTEEDYIKLLRGFGPLDRALSQQIERRIMSHILSDDDKGSCTQLFHDWRDSRRLDELVRREQLGALVREALQTVSTRLHAQDREELETVLKEYETNKYAASVRSHIGDMLKGAREAFDVICTKYGSFMTMSGRVSSFDEVVKLFKADPETALLHEGLETLRSRSRLHITHTKDHLPPGEFFRPFSSDGPPALIRGLSGDDGRSDFDREATLRLIEDFGLDPAVPAAFVAPRRVSSTTYEEDGHFFFYQLDDLVLLIAMPDDRSAQFQDPGLQIYLIKADLEMAKTKALDAWSPVHADNRDNVFAFRHAWQPLEPGYDPRAFWHLIGDEGLKKVAAHLELRKQFPKLSAT